MLINRNVTTASGRTSMRLDQETWDALAEICHREDMYLGELITKIEQQPDRPRSGRTAAVRAYVVAYYRAAAQAGSHAAAGHGEIYKIAE